MDGPMMVRVFVSDGESKITKSAPGVVVSGPNGNNPVMASASVFRDGLAADADAPFFENGTNTSGPIPAFKPLNGPQRTRAMRSAGVWMEGEAFNDYPAV